MNVERTDFVSVPVTDLGRSTAWYRDTLGLQQVGSGRVARVPARRERQRLPDRPDQHRSRVPRAEHGAIALRVGDVEQTRRELESRGIGFHGETLDTGVCHMAFFTDPDGNALMLHRRYAPRG